MVRCLGSPKIPIAWWWKCPENQYSPFGGDLNAFRSTYEADGPSDESTSIMPNYEYHCEKCGKTFEVFQSMTAKRLTKCPDGKCKGKVTRLLGTGAGLIFKGSGFYITDYRSESYKQGASSETKASTASDSGSSGAGESKSTPATKESKPEPKPESKPKPKAKSNG